MRYVYGVTSALLLAGSALALATGQPLNAQIAQNDDRVMPRVMPPAGAPLSFADLTEQLQPAVVNISTRQRVAVSSNPFAGTPFGDLFGDPGGGGPRTREAQSLGSGFIMSADGYVVTNNHVVSAGGRGEIQSITVIMPDRTEYEATLVGRDAASDLAVLKIDRDEPFPYVEFGDSTRSRVGDWVIAIGNPFGLGGTVTSGIISAVHRNTGMGGAYDRYLQTDASINRGNSGGPMFDLAGNVIGINNAIISPTGGSVGIGFAIPSEVAQPIVATQMRGGTVERGYLGVQIQPITDDLAAALGVPKNRGEFVQVVEPGSAAERAGLRAGDVVVEIDNKPVTPDQTVSYIVANIEPGSTTPIVVMRDGDRIRLNATLARRPGEEELAESFSAEPEEDFSDQGAEETNQAASEALGIAVTELTPSIARQIGVSPEDRGVVITAVAPTSDAFDKGLRRGDLVMSVNQRTTLSGADVDAAVSEVRAAGRDAVLVRVKRRNAPARYIAIRLQDAD